METKICRICGVEKPISEFSKNKQYTDGLDTRCKWCVNEYQKSLPKKHKAIAGNPALADFTPRELSRSFAQEDTRERSNLRKQ